MEAVRQSWTDDRLDDRFDHLEAEMDLRFRRVEGEMKAGFDRVDREIAALREDNAALRSDMREDGAALRAEIKESNAETSNNYKALQAAMNAQNSERISEFASLNRTLIQVGGGIIATIIGTVLLALLTQL